jgi:glycosyltransferase involved in cell wall biosynthesis
MQTKTKKGLIIGPPPENFLKKPNPGGVAVHIGGLIDFLEKQNIEIYMCYHKPLPSTSSRIFNSSKIKWFIAVLQGLIVLLNQNKKIFNSFLYTIKDNIIIAYYITTLRKIIKEINPDFIHIHHLYNLAPVALKLLQYDGKIIVTNHGFSWRIDSHSTKMMTRIKLIYHIINSIICVSESVYVDTLKMFNNSDKLIKIHNPTDFSKYPIKAN